MHSAGGQTNIDLSSFSISDETVDETQNGGGHIASELNDLATIHKDLKAAINQDYTANRAALDSAYSDALADASQADVEVANIQAMLDKLNAMPSNTQIKELANNSEHIKWLNARIEFATQALVAAQKKRDEIKVQVEVLKQMKELYDALEEAAKLQKKIDDDLAKAEQAKDGASGSGGTQEAADKKNRAAQKALDDATRAVSDLENALESAQDALDNLPLNATSEQRKKFTDIRDSIKEKLIKAQDALDTIKRDQKITEEAAQAAAEAEAAKNKQQMDEFEKKISGIIKQIGDTTKAASLQNVRDMLVASQLAAQQMAITGQGMIVQAKISLESEKMTVQQQLSELAMRAGATGYSNLLAQMAYAEAVREKSFNLEADLEKNRVDNAFTRAKAAAQLSKY